VTKRTLLVPGLIVALYAAWPYATLLKLRQDLRDHNVQALQQEVDWNSVRSGLKQQVTDSLTASFLATAQREGIPVVGLYETMPEPGYDYQSWMMAETNALERAAAHGISTERLK